MPPQIDENSLDEETTDKLGCAAILYALGSALQAVGCGMLAITGSVILVVVIIAAC